MTENKESIDKVNGRKQPDEKFTIVKLVDDNVLNKTFPRSVITGALINKGLFERYETDWKMNEQGIQIETLMTESDFKKMIDEFLTMKV